VLVTDLTSPPTIDRFLSALLGAAFLALYASTPAYHLVGGDGLQYTTILAAGGYAHPPGYPLYALYLRAAGALAPWAPPVAASAATTLSGIAAILALYGAGRAWRLAPPAAALVAVTFGVAADTWLFHTQPEVFALNHLLAAGLLATAGPSGPFRGLGRVAAAGAIAGLGLAHHHSLVLMAPVGGWCLWIGLRETDQPWRAVGAGLAAGLACLSPYAAIAAADPAHFMFPWADVSSWSDLLGLFFRQRYGILELAADGTHRPLLHIGFLLVSAIADTFYLPIVFAVLGFAAHLGSEPSNHSGPSRPAVASLLAAFILTGPVFVSLFNLDPVGYRALTIRRHHLLFELHLVFAAGLGVQVLLDSLDRPRWIWALPAAAVAAGLLVARPQVLDHRGPEIEQYLTDTFHRLPDRAIVLGAHDLDGFGLDYYHRALERRRDVDYVHLPALRPESSYTRLVERRLPTAVPFDGPTADARALIDKLVASDRPVFASPDVAPEALADRPTRPRGTLIRVLPGDARPDPPDEMLRAHEAFLADSPIDPDADPPPTTWRFAVMLQYAAVWNRLARQLAAKGRHDLAERARQRRETFAPDYEKWTGGGQYE